MEKLITNRVINTNDLFSDDLIEARALYLHAFNGLPSNFFIGSIDGEKAFAAFSERYCGRITRTYRYQWYDSKKKEAAFSRVMLLLDNESLVEFYVGLCEIWHNGQDDDFLMEVAKLAAPFKQRQRREPLEINVVIRGKNKLELKPMEIKRTRLDLGLYYNPDFGEVDTTIRQRLNKGKDKGIVLLHGLPGTGKTTYLRYLISRMKKRVLFVSPAVADDLMNPDFIELLTSNPDTVLIIEDAENVIMDRRHNPGSSVSNLLNISDGLLADFLNVQLICTFNNSLTLIDSALLRKGRLIAKYEFGKLDAAQSQRLSTHLGFDTIITRPMTIAEIANQNERQVNTERMEVLGFRSHSRTN
jgi:ATPase family associated with various cellular activities (AAA)